MHGTNGFDCICKSLGGKIDYHNSEQITPPHQKIPSNTLDGLAAVE